MLTARMRGVVISSTSLSGSSGASNFLGGARTFAGSSFANTFLRTNISRLAVTYYYLNVTLRKNIVTTYTAFFMFSSCVGPTVHVTTLVRLPIGFV